MLYKSETLGSMRQLLQLGNVLRNSIVSLEQDRQRTSFLLLLGSYFLLLEINFFFVTHIGQNVRKELDNYLFISR